MARTKDPGQGNFLDGLYRDQMHESVSEWRLPELPSLHGVSEVFMDFESTGVRWWDGDVLIGGAILTDDGRSWYFPVRHRVGPNIDPATFFRWCKGELAGKKITNIRTKFDLHLARRDGVNFDDLGCTFGDVAHYAALLDDHRQRFNQEVLARDILKDPAGKMTTVNGFVLDPTKFADYPAGLIAHRAIHDVTTVARLKAAMWPQLTAEDLHRVRELEEQIIPAVVEMEHNGAPINQEKLHLWCEESQRDLEAVMWRIQKAGHKLATPDSRDDIMRMFKNLKIEVPLDPETGQPSFADSLLEKIEHPTVQDLREAKQLASLRSKFLLKYQSSTSRDGILRYELHQLPFQREDEDGGGGAVSGRFSSAAPNPQEGANVQQVFGVKRQKKSFTKKYIIRELFVPQEGLWGSADASQIEYRIFGDKSRDKKIIEAYRTDAKTDYHELVQRLINEFTGKDLIREDTKAVNFAQVYGAGIRKLASQLKVPANQIPAMDEPLDAGGPKFQEVVKLSETYHGMFPTVKPTLQLASHLAMPGHKEGDRGCGRACRDFYRRGLRHRGYVKTVLGRRARFGPHDRHYSALNRSIQGSAADINKLVLVALHRNRHQLEITPRFTVHDEFNGDFRNPSKMPQIIECFNTQYHPLRVPIIWDVRSGANWAEAKSGG
jgi:DNA polymerase I-like protein with 3'-5' exonuclease and polymerase domains